MLVTFLEEKSFKKEIICKIQNAVANLDSWVPRNAQYPTFKICYLFMGLKAGGHRGRTSIVGSYVDCPYTITL